MTNLAAVQHRADVESVVDLNDPRAAQLQKLIVDHSLLKGDFTLSSGRTSKYLFQLRQTTMLPEAAFLLGDIIVDYMKAQAIHSVGGLAVGAVPLVSYVSVLSHLKNWPMQAFFVRKEPKKHGARERIDGHVGEGEILFVDDVATSGGSIITAIQGTRDEHPKCKVDRALVIVDREEGAAQNLAREGIELVSIFKRSDFNIEI